MNLRHLHNAYRAKHNLPFPDEIRRIRKRYDLSAKKMPEVLGFGVNGYGKYEHGEVPSSSNGELIQLAKDSKQFHRIVTLSDALRQDEK